MGLTDEIRNSIRMAQNIGSTKDKYIKKSIARGASDAIMQFSVLISDTIPVNMAHVLVRNFDRIYGVFAQTYFSLNSTINISANPSASNYIRRFHQNLTEESKTDILNNNVVDLEKLCEDIDEGNAALYKNYNNSFGLLFEYKENAVFAESNRKLLTELDNNPFVEDGSPSANEAIVSYLQKQKKKEIADVQRNIKTPELLDRNDIKKVNDMQPLTMSIRLMGVNDKDEFVQYVDFICGIKSVLHLVKSETMCDEIDKSIRNTSKLFNFIRWTTGELSLFKDLIFGVNQIRGDIASRSSGTVPFFGTLRRLRDRKIDISGKGVNNIIPNATIVISAYEIKSLHDTYGYDMRDIRMAKRLMDALMLLAFVIVDEGLGTIDILYDGRNGFESYSLDSLERETIQQSAKLSKELARMIGTN